MKKYYLLFIGNGATMTTDSYSVVRYAEENGWRRVSKSEYDSGCREIDKRIKPAKRTRKQANATCAC